MTNPLDDDASLAAAFLSPEDAKLRFGKLLYELSDGYKHFHDPAGRGQWEPEYGPGMLLIGYNLRLWHHEQLYT